MAHAFYFCTQSFIKFPDKSQPLPTRGHFHQHVAQSDHTAPRFLPWSASDMTLNEKMLLPTLKSEVTPTTLTLGSVEAFLMLLGDLGRSAWRGEAGWECGGPLDWLWEWCRGMAGSGVTACTGRGRRVASRLRELFLFSHIICTSSILFSTCSTGHTCL